MKALVVGGGSIGTRHLQNLKALGLDKLGLVETDGKRRVAIAKDLGTAEFATLADGLHWSPDFVVVSTPPHQHVQQALQVARYGCDLFVEKPLSHTTDGLAELSELVEHKKLVSLVGCNMRFHPGPLKVKQLIQKNSPGRILFARIHAGSYLPSWRPGTDYRENYAAREQTGGGCILDGIHEIDLARWYLGNVQEVFCAAGHLSSLEISTEDVAVLFCRHSNSAFSEIHLDYVQRTYERGCQIVGEKGSIFWDFNGGQVRWYDAVTGQWTAFLQPVEWSVNHMYVDEMRHFLDCVRTRHETTLPILDALGVMQIVSAAKASIQRGRMVRTEAATAA
jgi:predicted dehydrogenase